MIRRFFKWLFRSESVKGGAVSTAPILDDVTWSERRTKEDKRRLSQAIVKIRNDEMIDANEVTIVHDDNTVELVPIEIHVEMVKKEPELEERKQELLREFGQEGEMQ